MVKIAFCQNNYTTRALVNQDKATHLYVNFQNLDFSIHEKLLLTLFRLGFSLSAACCLKMASLSLWKLGAAGRWPIRSADWDQLTNQIPGVQHNNLAQVARQCRLHHIITDIDILYVGWLFESISRSERKEHSFITCHIFRDFRDFFLQIHKED